MQPAGRCCIEPLGLADVSAHVPHPYIQYLPILSMYHFNWKMLRRQAREQWALPRQLMPSRVSMLLGAAARGLMSSAVSETRSGQVIQAGASSTLLCSIAWRDRTVAFVSAHTPVLQKLRTKLIVISRSLTLLPGWMGLLPHFLQPCLMRALTDSLTCFPLTFSSGLSF
jgi:hypothetical protein